jgi:hypothetical protein
VNYEKIRDEIKAQLRKVSGMGAIYTSERYVTDWGKFYELHTDSTGKVNVAMITRVSAQEMSQGIGSEDASGELEVIQRTEVWRIQILVGYKDDPDVPSEDGKSTLEDMVQERFRFLQDLNGAAPEVFSSSPLRLISSGMAMFGEVLSHKSVLEFTIQQRILNPN